MDLRKNVAALSDLAAVAICEELAAALLAQPDVSLDAAVAALPPMLAGDPDLAALHAGLEERYHFALPPEISVPLARSLLDAAAGDPALAPALAAVLDAHRDTKQFVLEVLALGAAVSMVIFAATTSYKDGRIEKKVLTPAQAEQFGAWLRELKPWASSNDG
ncbi:hypothetical protein FFK22_040650 [Mycobacterium sp. KBS0706]|uniref:hypothetical protein n=1 Tax=Mycobacterium sp. KBS0706 TaxID=2578109 RepID=UPI00110F6F6C|nr:hypothetical protein [Mycobacterium sp. KBS0706]TSD82899.1 hypothetical protein FFK22_040650 [Mycobacterium sp. KBS0706]